MSLTRRRISLTFTLGKGDFGEDGEDTVTLTGVRCSATISKAGGVSSTHANLRIFGMSQSLMNKLSTLGKPLIDGRNNQISISAGDDESGMGVCFIGIIQEAWADYAGAPDVVFVVNAFTALLDQMKPVPPSSYPGAADVEVIMRDLATRMGYAFKNDGVATQLSNPYFPGTALQQVKACAAAAGINWTIDADPGLTLTIWPQQSSRGAQSILLSPTTGLVGYPTHTQNGISLVSLYNPSISYGIQVVVETSVTPAAGGWTIFSVTHELEAETPNGRWFTIMEGSVLGRPVPLSS